MSKSALKSGDSGEFVRVGVRDIWVTSLGQGPALLMLHGGGPGATGTSNFIRNVEALAKHFRLIVPDMPGYGRSTKGVDRADPFGDLANSMHGLLEALGVQRAHILGNSLGGACALRMALERPERVDRLVLLGPGGIDTTQRPPTDGLKFLLGYYGGEGPTREKLATFLRKYLVFDGSSVTDAVVDERFAASIDPETLSNPPLVPPKNLAEAHSLDLTLDVRLVDLQTPTLVLWGMEDLVNAPVGAHSLQTRMPRCDVFLFSRTGHWVQWERADEFNAATIAFLSQGAEQRSEPSALRTVGASHDNH